MLAVKKIVKSNTSFVMMSNVGVAALNMFSFMILARLLTPFDFGIWSLFLTILVPTELLRAGIVRTALIKLKQESDDHKKQVPISAIFLLTTIAIATCIIALLIGLIFNDYLVENNYMIMVWALIASTIVRIPQEYSIWNSQADSNFKYMAASFFSVGVFWLLGIIIVYALGGGLFEIFIAHVISRALPSVWAIIIKDFPLKLILRTKMNYVKEIWDFGKFSLTTLISTSFLRTIDTFLLAFFIGPTAVAMYSVPNRWVELVNIPIKSANQTFFPKAAKRVINKQYDLLKKELNRVCTFFVLFTFLIVIFTFIAARPMTLIIAGPEYLETTNYLRFLMFAAATSAVGNFMGVTLDALGKPNLNAKMVTSLTVINFVLDGIGLLIYEDIWSVIIVTLICKWVGMVYLAVNLRRILDWSLRDFIFVKLPLNIRIIFRILRMKLKTYL